MTRTIKITIEGDTIADIDRAMTTIAIACGRRAEFFWGRLANPEYVNERPAVREAWQQNIDTLESVAAQFVAK